MTSLTTALEVSRARETTALEGQVALDNDDTPSFPVPESVVAAAETVPALESQTPVHLWVVGRLALDRKGRVKDHVDTVGTRELPGNTFAFETVDDAVRVLGRPLSRSEKRTLAEGGGS